MSNTLDSNLPDRDATGDRASDDTFSPTTSTLEVEIIIDESVDSFATCQMMEQAVRASAVYRGYRCGEVGIRVTDDSTIRELNRVHLGHDYPTDVISFGYDARTDYLSGELVVSADTAEMMSTKDWPAAAELLLYIVHGTLHITGMDDHDVGNRVEMRRAEQAIMTNLGFANIQQYGADEVMPTHQRSPECKIAVKTKGPNSSC